MLAQVGELSYRPALLKAVVIFQAIDFGSLPIEVITKQGRGRFNVHTNGLPLIRAIMQCITAG
ncbi:MAG: hypothetical protein G5701_05415 [Serratia symbiotica]|nr:hypothetical protein [Serratia symbiotica]